MRANSKHDRLGLAGVLSGVAPAARSVEFGAFGEAVNFKRHVPVIAYALIAFVAALLGSGSVRAQVSPGEITNPKLKATEQAYLPQLQSLHHAISEAKFPLPFILTRYVSRDPDRQASLDTRGLEFVIFQNRLLLKTSGFYTAAFNSDDLTSNERASRTLQEVVIPILRLMVQVVPADVECDGIGFEIAYHVRAARKNSDFEGREILAVVLDRAEAFALAAETGNAHRQAILDRSTIYLDGKPFGLALGQRDVLNLEALGRRGSGEDGPARALPASTSSLRLPGANTQAAPATINMAGGSKTHAPSPDTKMDPNVPATTADVERLQAQYQPELDALLKAAGEKLAFVEYAPPTFAVYHKQLVLQFTLRNPLSFEKSSSSIYRRAARSFDLYLAPQLKVLLAKLPPDLPVEALDFSLLNRSDNETNASEAVEFVCPLSASRSFAEDEITSQDLINQSIVLMNGVRINLDLERVE